MTGPSGITPSNDKPEELSAIEGLKGGQGGEDVGALLHAKVGTLGELKAALIKYLGKKEGEKFYNQFLTSFAMLMIQQMQTSAKQAKGNT